MEIYQLRYFREVALRKSFTKASETLRVAQPAVSKSIKKLEEELQLSLIDRSEKQISLTPEGEIFLHHVNEILHKIDEAKTEMYELRGLEKGEIRIGLPSMFGSYFFPHMIKEFKKRHPSLLITVVEEGTLQIQRLIERKEVDVGFIVLDHPPEHFEVLPLLKEDMVVCVPSNHPLCAKRTVSYGELLDEPLVLFKEGYFQRKLIEQASRATGVVPNVTFSSNQLSLIKSLISEGVGITLFLKMVIRPEDKLTALALNPPVTLELAAAWKKNSYLSRASQAFLHFLKQQQCSYSS